MTMGASYMIALFGNDNGRLLHDNVLHGVPTLELGGTLCGGKESLFGTDVGN